MYKSVSIVGAGTWGVALASHLEPKTLVEVTHYRELFLKKLDKNRRHPQLPGFKISENILFKREIRSDTDLLIVASPVQHMRKVLSKLDISKDIPILILSKGIEQKTLMFPVDIVKDTMNIQDRKISVLSGPSHAEEVIKRNPTSVVISSRSKELERELQELLSDKHFRVYCNEDIIGVQLGGAVKNVISIAAGIVIGLGYGDNTVSALLTRGIYELKALGLKLGAKKETLN